MKIKKQIATKKSIKPVRKRERPEITREDDQVREEKDLEEFEEELEDELFGEFDAIEVEEDEGEKITYGSFFSPKDGDLGDESEDTGDLPETLRKNRYDPTLSAPPESSSEPDNDELLENMRVTNEDKAGLGYGANDYSEEE
ncbi:MAG: hypothetical protein H0V01_02215 [Bacteroidetes bacterium]|nr:hypothetical protein [Bacteroidota bacterium]HET6243589.1 hypothetical protein [Bacteroidia bacterium]